MSSSQSIQLSLSQFEKYSSLPETPKSLGISQQQGGNDASPALVPLKEPQWTLIHKSYPVFSQCCFQGMCVHMQS